MSHPFIPHFIILFMDTEAHSTANNSNPDVMPTEAEFTEQAELARTALEHFLQVKDWKNCDDTKVTLINQMMKTTVRFISSWIFKIVRPLSFYPAPLQWIH